MNTSKRIHGHQRHARSRPDTEIQVQFVTVGVPGQAETAESRAVVRANAAHFHWRHNRPPRDTGTYKPKPKSKRLRHGGVEKTASLKWGSKSSSRTTISPSVKDHVGATKNQELRNLDTCAAEHRLERDDEESNPAISLPFEDGQISLSLSQSLQISSDFVSRCISYNARVILPALFPDANDSSNIRTNMLQLSISNSTVSNIFTMGALMYSQRSFGEISGKRISLEAFRFRAEIIRYLRIAIRDPVEACKDINIFAVSSLANSGLFQKVDVPSKVPKQGPLRSLQYLGSFGLTEREEAHVDGLSKMIEFKGGFEKIKMPGLTLIISFLGLRVATRDLTSPRFPLVTQSCPMEEFHFQHRAIGFGSDPDLYEALSMLKSYTMMIDDYCEGRKFVTPFLLIDYRNMTQYTLLSLPPKRDTSECLRLAALIYSLLVVFPLPYIAAPFRQLVRLLISALETWDGENHMLIWVLTMGGIGAIGLEDRQFFVKEFRKLVTRMGIQSWDEARDLIKTRLWFGPTNDEDGSDFWRESQDFGLRRFRG